MKDSSLASRAEAQDPELAKLAAEQHKDAVLPDFILRPEDRQAKQLKHAEPEKEVRAVKKGDKTA